MSIFEFIPKQSANERVPESETEEVTDGEPQTAGSSLRRRSKLGITVLIAALVGAVAIKRRRS